MAELFHKLSHKTSRQWIVEGDIKGCFDNINHDYITDTLKAWHVTNGISQSIRLMLKSKIFYEGNMTASEKGTPQGGVISPLLANVALTTLDEFCQQFGRKTVSPIVRYADDFVIVCESEQWARLIRARVSQHLQEKVGLELSGEKTRITHITDGFDFLGFNFRKYKESNIGVGDKEKLLIKPQAEKVSNFRYKLKNILKECKSSTQEAVIRRINPVITGWGNYYRHVVSKATFENLDYHVFQKLVQWTKGKHQDIKHFSKKGKTLVFRDKETGIQISTLSTIPIKRFIKVRIDHRVYDVNSKEYWEMREYQNAKDSVWGSGVLSKLFGKQHGKCAYCKQPITKDEISQAEFHKHHMKPRSESGDEKLSNLRLLHKACHVDLHAMYTRKEMGEYADIGIDYLRLMKAKSS
jgi:RNA-directed DNA polymerase